MIQVTPFLLGYVMDVLDEILLYPPATCKPDGDLAAGQDDRVDVFRADLKRKRAPRLVPSPPGTPKRVDIRKILV